MTDMFSVQVANRIAAYLDIPNLFIGTHQDTRIDYLHVSYYQTRYVSSVLAQCIVIKSSRGLIGTLLDTKGTLFPIVQLPDEADDPLYDLLKRYKQFPDGVPAPRVTGLAVLFHFEQGMLQYYIYDPRFAADPSKQLFEAYVRLERQIRSQFQNAEAILPEPAQLPPSNPIIDDSRFNSFARRCKIMAIFGQSGLFDELDTPHDTEYLLECEVLAYTFIFIKTRQFFRGIRYGRDGEYRPGVDPMLDMEAPDEDLIALFTEQPLPVPVSRKTIFVRNCLSVKDGDLFADLTVIPEEDSPALWHVLKTLIEQFPEEHDAIS